MAFLKGRRGTQVSGSLFEPRSLVTSLHLEKLSKLYSRVLGSAPDPG